MDRKAETPDVGNWHVALRFGQSAQPLLHLKWPRDMFALRVF